MSITRQMMELENEKFMRNMKELEESRCQNILGTGLGCSVSCAKYRTAECLHPEKVSDAREYSILLPE